MFDSIARHFWEISAISLVMSVAIVAVIAVSLTRLLRDRSISRYDEERHQVQLSEMRKAYDSQIYNLTMTLLATEGRWKEINHLLLSAQQLQPDLPSNKVAYSNFLAAAGLREEDLKVDPKLVFVLTPFDPMYFDTYRAIVDVCQRAGLRCLRGDEEHAGSDVLPHVLRLMVRSRLVIANISARNPNVFYELGIAHAIDKPTILISHTLDLPFDVKSKRVLMFTTIAQLEEQLRDAMLRVFSEPVT